MKRLLPIFIALVLLPFLAHSQISLSLEPQSFILTGTPSQTDIAYHVKVYNTGSQTATVLWSRRVTGAPAEWWTWICDSNLCYEPHVNACPPSKPNVIAAGDSIEVQLHLNPRNVEGSGEFDLTLTDMDGTPLATIDGQVFISTTSTSAASGDVKLTVYPNPTSDYFQISELAGLRQVEVFNIVGTKIKSYDAAPQKQYFVGDLSEGMYLVRLISSSKKILKTVRLSVR